MNEYERAVIFRLGRLAFDEPRGPGKFMSPCLTALMRRLTVVCPRGHIFRVSQRITELHKSMHVYMLQVASSSVLLTLVIVVLACTSTPLVPTWLSPVDNANLLTAHCLALSYLSCISEIASTRPKYTSKYDLPDLDVSDLNTSLIRSFLLACTGI